MIRRHNWAIFEEVFGEGTKRREKLRNMGAAKIYKIYTSCWLEKKEERKMKRKRMGGETKKKEQDSNLCFSDSFLVDNF